LGVQTVDNAAYALGPSGAWISGNKQAISTATAIIVCTPMLVAWRGLALGKWINGLGSIGLRQWFHGNVAVAPVDFTIPALTIFNLNILGKMAFGALAGFDSAAVFAGECRDASVASSIRRSVRPWPRRCCSSP
jgi:hypothetical protein